jgi:hypothetical protein
MRRGETPSRLRPFLSSDLLICPPFGALLTSRNVTSREFGLPTCPVWAFYVKLTPNRPTSGRPVNRTQAPQRGTCVRKLSSNTPTFRTLYLNRSSCWNRKGANHLAPSLTLIALRSHRSFPELFHTTSDTRAAARHNLVPAGVEDLKRN